MPPTQLDFKTLVGEETWELHWKNYEQIISLMREAEVTAAKIRDTIKNTYLLTADRHPATDSED